MISFALNGTHVQAEEGATVLEAAAAAGVQIPSLCHREGTDRYGVCRLCLVRVSHQGRTQLQPSCVYRVEEGMDVQTETDQVRECRRILAELLLARFLESGPVKEVARSVGVTETSLAGVTDECVSCGLCIHACEAVIGSSAIRLIEAGPPEPVDSRIAINAQACIGCGACATVCPTGAIRSDDFGSGRGMRSLDVQVELRECQACGARFATKRVLNVVMATSEVAEDVQMLCEECRRARLSRSLLSTTPGAGTASGPSA